MKRFLLALLALPFSQMTQAEILIADASAFSAGTDVSGAYTGVVLSTAEASMIVNDLAVTEQLHLISANTTAVYTTDTYFSHSSGSLWSAGQCCGGDLALRADFTRPTSSVAVLFIPDDTDTAVLQIYDGDDNLLAEVLDRKNTPMTLSLNSPSVPIAYALATFGDTGLITTLSYTQTAISVVVDIKPGAEPNSINLASRQAIPVAILTTEDFDALTIDTTTARFGPSGAAEAHSKRHEADIDGDGDIDLLLHFNVQETGLQCGDIEATLTAETFDGLPVEGTDSVNIVRCNS